MDTLDDAVEAAAGVAEALGASAELVEVISSLGNDVVEKLELNASFCSASDLDVEIDLLIRHLKMF